MKINTGLPYSHYAKTSNAPVLKKIKKNVWPARAQQSSTAVTVPPVPRTVSAPDQQHSAADAVAEHPPNTRNSEHANRHGWASATCG